MKILGVMCLLASAAMSAAAQEEADLMAKQRVFQGVGPGLRAVKRATDGRLYILASPAPGLLVFDAQGKQVLSINETGVTSGGTQTRARITYGEDCDGAADGTIYVADRGANLVQVFSREGNLIRSIAIKNPVAIAALPEQEVAVATLNETHLVMVFDKNGRDVREFGDPEQTSEREELNRFLNIGQLATDAQGRLFYAFGYLPEPTVRIFDRQGYAAGEDIQYTGLEAMPAAQAARKEIVRQEKQGKPPSFKRILTAVGVDRKNGEVWIALYNNLLHFDKEGNRRATYKIYTPQGARLEANTILVEEERLLIGSDPLGIYEFNRPDKKTATR